MAVSKIIYTNGILTDARGAAATAEQINQLTGIDTEVIHNGSTSLGTAGKIGPILLRDSRVSLGMHSIQTALK
jgi:hypothetical protein